MTEGENAPLLRDLNVDYDTLLKPMLQYEDNLRMSEGTQERHKREGWDAYLTISEGSV